MTAPYEQDRLNLTEAFGHDWIVWPAGDALTRTVTWLATRKQRPTTDEYIDGIREHLTADTAKGLRVEILDQYHLEAVLFELGHAKA